MRDNKSLRSSQTRGKISRRLVGAGGRSAFTLIELLVVVAIIAVLISILLPSLSAARRSARATKCGVNLRSAGQAVMTYASENGGGLPASYLYANNHAAAYDLGQQRRADRDQFGYVHWSFYLFNRGQAKDGTFQCPEVAKGGHPRTFPGRDLRNWDAGQLDGVGSPASATAVVEDKQATRVAYAGNAAIFPRNKFNRAAFEDGGGSAQRFNVFVKDSQIEGPGNTILAAEYYQDWRLIGRVVSEVGGSRDATSLAHRPINVFSQDSGQQGDPYSNEPGGSITIAGRTEDYSGFSYTPGITGTSGGGGGDLTYGIRSESEVQQFVRSGGGSGGLREVNLVGRHHPGGDNLGGTGNFLYADGHVERTTIMKTMKERQWGTRFYSLTGVTLIFDRFRGVVN